MAFMEPYYSNGAFLEIETRYEGTIYVPDDVTEVDEDGGDTIVARYIGKWFCHLSAAGYMDQTEWSGPFDTLDEAREYIRDTYEVDPDTGDDLDEKSEDED